MLAIDRISDERCIHLFKKWFPQKPKNKDAKCKNHSLQVGNKIVSVRFNMPTCCSVCPLVSRSMYSYECCNITGKKMDDGYIKTDGRDHRPAGCPLVTIVEV